jgi:LysM repeat protein
MATTHIVKAGETLWSLAKKYGTTVAELAKLNNISDPNLIITGETLVIEGEPVTPEPSTTYRVNVTDYGLQNGTDRTLVVRWT